MPKRYNNHREDEYDIDVDDLLEDDEYEENGFDDDDEMGGYNPNTQRPPRRPQTPPRAPQRPQRPPVRQGGGPNSQQPPRRPPHAPRQPEYSAPLPRRGQYNANVSNSQRRGYDAPNRAYDTSYDTPNRPPAPPAPPAPTPKPQAAKKTKSQPVKENYTPSTTLDDNYISTKGWILNNVLTIIPIVNIIYILITAFSHKVCATKKNWARATLILGVVMGILTGIVGWSLYSVLGNSLPFNNTTPQAPSDIEWSVDDVEW